MILMFGCFIILVTYGILAWRALRTAGLWPILGAVSLYVAGSVGWILAPALWEAIKRRTYWADPPPIDQNLLIACLICVVGLWFAPHHRRPRKPSAQQ